MAVGAAFVTVSLWASAFVGIRSAGHHLSPGALALGRLLVGSAALRLLVLVRRYPALVDGAFVIIAWVGLKLLLEYLRVKGLTHVEVNKWFSFGLIVVIFLISYVYARRLGPADEGGDEAERLLMDEDVRSR